MLSRAINYLKNGRYSKALAVVEKEIRQNPSKEAYMTLGCVLMGLDRDYEAMSAFHTAIYGSKYLNKNFSGLYTEAMCNYGMLHYYYEKDAAALEIYKEGIESKPTWDLMWNAANVMLRMYMSGKYANLKMCWQMYESRFRCSEAVKLGSIPNWTGGVHVDSITVLAEQGIGDAIMFGRYLPEVAKWCSELVIECEESVNCIFSKYKTRNFNGFDTTHAIPMCSLGNLLDDIPAGDWLGGWVGGSSNIIGVWQSLQKHNNVRYRNCSIDGLLKAGIKCSLGPDCQDERIPHLPSDNWEETIESLKTAKLVVSVDTAVVHLCGAMGVPCLALMPLKNSDWRWGDSSCGENNLWYKSVRVIRNPNNWDYVYKKVGEIVRSQ
jgi:hypothetical protein